MSVSGGKRSRQAAAAAAAAEFLQANLALTGFTPQAALYQGVRELVENAIDAGARAIHVDVEARCGECACDEGDEDAVRSWALRVDDDGTGFPRGSLSDLAGAPFATTKRGGDTIGRFGVGLKAMVLAAQQHAGDAASGVVLEIMTTQAGESTATRCLIGTTADLEELEETGHSDEEEGDCTPTLASRCTILAMEELPKGSPEGSGTVLSIDLPGSIVGSLLPLLAYHERLLTALATSARFTDDASRPRVTLEIRGVAISAAAATAHRSRKEAAAAIMLTCPTHGHGAPPRTLPPDFSTHEAAIAAWYECSDIVSVDASDDDAATSSHHLARVRLLAVPAGTMSASTALDSEKANLTRCALHVLPSVGGVPLLASPSAPISCQLVRAATATAVWSEYGLQALPLAVASFAGHRAASAAAQTAPSDDGDDGAADEAAAPQRGRGRRGGVRRGYNASKTASRGRGRGAAAAIGHRQHAGELGVRARTWIRAHPPLPMLAHHTHLDIVPMARRLHLSIVQSTVDDYPYVPLRALFIAIDVPAAATVTFADMAKTAVAGDAALEEAVVAQLHSRLQQLRGRMPGAFTRSSDRMLESVRRLYVPALAGALSSIVAAAAGASAGYVGGGADRGSRDLAAAYKGGYDESGEDVGEATEGEAFGSFASEALTWPPAPTVASLATHLESCLACTIEGVLATAAALQASGMGGCGGSSRSASDRSVYGEGGGAGLVEVAEGDYSGGNCGGGEDSFVAVEMQLAAQAAKASSRNAGGGRSFARKRRRIEDEGKGEGGERWGAPSAWEVDGGGDDAFCGEESAAAAVGAHEGVTAGGGVVAAMPGGGEAAGGGEDGDEAAHCEEEAEDGWTWAA